MGSGRVDMYITCAIGLLLIFLMALVKMCGEAWAMGREFLGKTCNLFNKKTEEKAKAVEV